MSNRFCTGCGAPLTPDMKICPRCGKVAAVSARPRPQQRAPRPQQPVRNVRTVRTGQTVQNGQTVRNSQPQARRPQTAPQRRPAPMPRPSPSPAPERQERAPKKRSKKARLIFHAATAAVVLVGLYFAIFFVQIFRVKISTYDFKTEIKLESSNYGQAMESYFESGKWSVNPLTGTCTYTGTTKHGDEYEIVYTARLKVDVKNISINGKDVRADRIESTLMGMFI
ncbi:hypothetical protein [Ruminococcus sp. 210702-SL.1.03]|uniref:hypothetical protein n=1 Tax=Ruminococcus sp. 210702-SL.1.03 TaxID=2883233 RepID=UPI001D079F71|nr:hypothetical protein [Ruminococcus sp. 210702-SL.1.03]MCB6615051.1 hypothetical protein [Ruminococcus sp. 210702-SL.1.03]